MKREYIVSTKEELLSFLRTNLTSKSKNNLKSLLAKEMVLVNGKVQTKFNFILFKGDKVEIRDTKIKTDNNYKKEIKIIYEDDDIIVVNKPCGLLSIATSKEKEYTLYHFISTHLKERNKNNKVFIIHRLDKDTSGIVIFAKNQKTKNLFQNNWDKIIRGRYYYAVVNGSLKEKEGTIKEYLIENDKTYMVYSTNNKKEGKLAITDYKVIKENNNYSLLDINIKTGRKNQIRVALKDIGNPIVGDKKYGDGKSSINRMALHQYKLELMDPRTNKFIRFKTDMPITFKKLI
ncbi:MAG: RluA family pseudouridine synthase [Bacilli bacterium]|nr:RluA family pseudouridine synthase [Bacilli bacterium]